MGTSLLNIPTLGIYVNYLHITVTEAFFLPKVSVTFTLTLLSALMAGILLSLTVTFLYETDVGRAIE